MEHQGKVRTSAGQVVVLDEEAVCAGDGRDLSADTYKANDTVSKSSELVMRCDSKPLRGW